MWLTKEQESAVDICAKQFKWDEDDVETLSMKLWALFHYYVKRLRNSSKA